MPEQLLVLRPGDLVVLGVEHRGCVLQSGGLRAVEAGATLTVLFPPQAVAESGAVPAGGVGETRLSGPSRITVPLDEGEEVPLDPAGLLAVLTSRPLQVGDSVVEMPFGVELAPRGTDGSLVAAAATEPVAGPVTWPAGLGPGPGSGDVTTALWQLVIADAAGGTGARAAVEAGVVGAPLRDELPEPAAPSPGDRGQLHAAGATAQVGRMRLSALGGTLTASASSPELEWDHDLALGRDRRVRVLRSGVLFPFGHRAVVETFAERRVADGVASIQERTVLRVTDPVRAYGGDGSSSREWPFETVEVLSARAGELDRVVLVQMRDFVPPPGWDAAQEQQLAGPRQELETARTDLDSRLPLPLPATVAEVCAGSWAPSGWADHDYRTTEQRQALADVETAIAEAQAAARADELAAGRDPAGVDAWVPAELAERRREVVAALETLDAERRALEAEALAILEQLHRERAAGEAECARLEQALADLRARLAGYAPALISAIHTEVDGAAGPEHRFALRLSGRQGALDVTNPLLFLHDVRMPATADHEAWRSLDDPSVTAGFTLGPLAVGPAVVDLVRREGPPVAVDLQEVHALTVGSVRHEAGTVRPVLGDLRIAVPELRALVPGTDTVVTARLTPAFLSTGDTSVLLALDPVTVDFSGHAERGGGLVLPSFDADRISAEHGPVAGALLPGADDAQAARAALSAMRLFGLPLVDLLTDLDLPPMIEQAVDSARGGAPHGVRMTWHQRLRSSRVFVAHAPGEVADTTTLDLQVEHGLDTARTTCTLSAFSLALPAPDLPLVAVDLGGLAFTVEPGRAPDLAVRSLSLAFGGALDLLASLQQAAGLGGIVPEVTVRDDGIAAAYTLAIPSAPAVGFTMSGIALTVAVWVPFRDGEPRVDVDFASPAAPFTVSVPPFGGSGYLGIGVGAGGLDRVRGSLELGGSAEVDFVVAAAEVHVRAGASIAWDGATLVVAGFLHLGGSLELLGLVTIAVDLRVELAYHGAGPDPQDPARPPRTLPPRLTGRATLVVEIDLTLYADSVELDTGTWTLLGGTPGGDGDGPQDAREVAGPVTDQAWDDYQEAFA